MGRVKKVATNIPEDLLREATSLTGLNQTQALIAGLRELIAEQRRSRLLDLKGKIDVSIDLDRTRERRRV